MKMFLKTIMSLLVFSLASPSMTVAFAAPGKSTATSGKGKPRPHTIRNWQVKVYNEASLKSGLAARQMRDAHLSAGKSLSKPTTRVRGQSSRGGNVNPRAQVPGRSATSGRGSRGTGVRAAKGKPWSYYNRNPKKVTKRRKNGRTVTFKSSKPRKKPAPKRSNSIVSERLGRVQPGPNGEIPQFTKGGPNNAGNSLQYDRAIDAPRSIQLLTPPTPRAQRQTAKVTRWGTVKKFFSSKK